MNIDHKLVPPDRQASALRVLFVLGELRNDGIAVYCERLARLLPFRCDLLVRAVSPTRSGSGDSQAYGAIHERPDLFGRPGLRRWQRLTRFLRSEGYSLIHLHELHLLSMVAPPAKLARIPLVGTSHLEARGSAQWNRTKKLIFAWGLSHILADKYVAISTDIMEEFRYGYRIPRRKLDRILTGVDLNHFRLPTWEERSVARSELGLDADTFTLTQMGRLTEIKNPQMTLLSAAAARRQLDQPLQLLFAGEGPLRSTLAAEAHRLGLSDTVSFIGHREPRDVLWATDVLCLPSRAEGLPLVVTEALACGVVPFRSRVSGYRDQVGGIAGLQEMDPDDPELNAKRLVELADDVHRAAISAECPARAAERFDQQSMSRAWQDLYQSLTR